MVPLHWRVLPVERHLDVAALPATHDWDPAVAHRATVAVLLEKAAVLAPPRLST
ncbi:MAG: hypothetical protein M9886_03975 [Candidatus Nanopelagicales bacterium]|nr:hypothetical protein [Candidatus Nanopelagicales bacterium]